MKIAMPRNHKTLLLSVLYFLCGGAALAETVIKRDGASPKDISTEIWHEGMPGPWIERGEICDHDFKESKLFLVERLAVDRNHSPHFFDDKGRYILGLGLEVEICRKCGVLRVSPKEGK